MAPVSAVENFSGSDKVNAALDLILTKSKRKKAIIISTGYLFGFVGMATLGIMLTASVSHVLAGSRINKLVQAVERVRYADEALTMSARMAACSGDMAWFDRYNTFLGPIDEAIANSVELYPEGAEEFLASTSVANDALVEMETKVYELVSRGASDDIVLANNIMTSDEYANNKTLLNSGLEDLVKQVEEKLELFEALSAEQTWVSRTVIISAIVLTFAVQVYIVRQTTLHSASERKHLFQIMVTGFNQKKKKSSVRGASSTVLRATSLSEQSGTENT